MAEVLREINQNKFTVNIPKEGLMNKVVINQFLGKKELRVCMYLMTILSGWSDNRRNSVYAKADDPKNYTSISISKISEILHLDKDDVEKSIKKLVKEGILEKGEGKSTKKGYRFTF